MVFTWHFCSIVFFIEIKPFGYHFTQKHISHSMESSMHLIQLITVRWGKQKTLHLWICIHNNAIISRLLNVISFIRSFFDTLFHFLRLSIWKAASALFWSHFGFWYSQSKSKFKRQQASFDLFYFTRKISENDESNCLSSISAYHLQMTISIWIPQA